MIKVYYWPFLVRNGSVVRMLDHKGLPYEWIKDKEEMAKVCSTWGAQGDTFAPPVVVDGDVAISQQVACTMYVANKCGFKVSGVDDAKILQNCLDVIDVFEGGWGKHNEDGAALRTWVEGDRMKRMMGNVERSIKGPFYHGTEPCAADFLLLAHMDWRLPSIFTPLKEKKGVDVMKDFPKMAAVHEALTTHSSYKDHGKMSPLKDEIWDGYN